MKFARKYQLVPVVNPQLNKVMPKTSEVDIPEHKKAKELKESLSRLLKTEPKDQQTAAEMSHLLTDYLHYKKYSPPDKYNFLNDIPKTYRSKAKRLIHESSIEWNEKGEIKTVFGQDIPASNIKDLIKEALVRGKPKHPPPVGWVIFLQQLASSPLALDFFSKDYIRKQIKAFRPEDEPDIKPPPMGRKTTRKHAESQTAIQHEVKTDILSEVKPTIQHDVKLTAQPTAQPAAQPTAKPTAKRKRQPHDDDVTTQVDVKPRLKPSLKPSVKRLKALKPDATSPLDAKPIQQDIKQEPSAKAKQPSTISKWLTW